MKRILVTGGRGFLSSRFTERFKHEFDILSPTKQQLNICDERNTFDVVKDFKPDTVIHAAALTATDYCNMNPDDAEQVNIKGAEIIAKACEVHQAKLIFLSTEQVFNGNMESGPYKESDTPVPNTVYGETKLTAEKNIISIMDQAWIVRLAWMFGMPQYNCKMAPNILWNVCEALIQNKPIAFSPNEFRSFTYIEDVLKNLVKLAEVPFGLYHFAAVNTLSRYETAAYIFKELGADSRIDDLLVCDSALYADKKRDARLDAKKAAGYGLIFDDSPAAISKCIREYDIAGF